MMLTMRYRLLAARCGKPGEGVPQCHESQITTQQPWNLNDADLKDTTPNFENPSCHSADMSYFVEHLHLATITKAIVNHMNSLTLTSIPIYPDLKIDPNLVIDSTPPFLRLYTYDRAPKDRIVFIQAYLLHSLTQPQRCHFNFANLSSLELRKICYVSAHAILDAERLFQHSQHRFMRIRFHLAATLGALFIACIVLLMETCVSDHVSFEPNLEQGNMADALKFLEEAKKHSVAAQKIWQGLNRVIEIFREKNMNRDIGGSVMTEKDMWGTYMVLDAERGKGEDANFEIREWSELFLDLWPYLSATF
jgi:hypothetical protein